jgi:hypothetical protein
MATEGQQFRYTGLVAGATLGSAQFKGMILNSSGDVILANTTSVVGTFIGILQNKPKAAGDAASVAYLGESKFKVASSTMAKGEFVACSTVGVGVALSTDANQIVGRIIAGSSGGARTVRVALAGIDHRQTT